MKNLLFAILSLGFVSAAQADISYSMPAVEAGFKWSSMELENSSSNKQALGFQLGGSIVLDFHKSFGIKTGLLYSERPFNADFAGNTTEGKITYADIPVLFMLKLEDYAGIYIGPSISMKIGDEVKGRTLTKVKSMVMPITLGGQFKFAPNFGLNIFFENISGEVADQVSNSRGIGANLLIAFD